MEAATAAKAQPTASRYLNPLCSTLEPGVATGSISCALRLMRSRNGCMKESFLRVSSRALRSDDWCSRLPYLDRV